MIERVLLVAWKGSTAAQWVETLRAGGYTVLLEDTTGERAWRTAKERGIDAVIIDGQKKPSHGRQTGHALRDTQKTRDIPIIWANLDAEDGGNVQAEVQPDITLPAPTNADEALEALRSLSTRYARSTAPVEATETAPPDPTLHAHVHSLMGTPSYVAAWTERTEPEARLIDPDAIAAERARQAKAEAEAEQAKKTGGSKPRARKASTGKATAKKAPVRKTVAKKTAVKKTAAKKTVAKKTAAKKTVAKKTATRKTAKKANAKKAPAKVSAARPKTGTRSAARTARPVAKSKAPKRR